MRPISTRPRAGAWGSDFRQRRQNQSPERKRRVQRWVMELMKRNPKLWKKPLVADARIAYADPHG